MRNYLNKCTYMLLLSRKRSVKALIVTAALYTIGWFVLVNLSNQPVTDHKATIIYENEHYIVYNPRCKIPKLDPLHPTVKHLVKRLPDLNCHSPSQVKVENNILKITTTNLSSPTYCITQPILRKDDFHIQGGQQIPVSSGDSINTSEFIKLECISDKEKYGNYKQFYPFIVRKERTEQRIKTYQQNNTFPKNEQFRIIMLGLDSVSKNQFLRHMLKTHEFMKQNLIYGELFGYNKIGKDTYSNIVPMFSGKLENEVPDTTAQFANVIPFIWNKYMNQGYRTLFAEDDPYIAIFNYHRNGFNEEPMDYYLRPWNLAVEHFISKWKTGCLNDRIETNVILNYMEDFYNVFSPDPLFAFTFITRLSHKNINYLSYQDKPVRDLLERLYLKGHLNNTIMFFFGDHGFRYGDLRYTHVGRIEGRLPFMFIIVPPWFPKKYPQMYRNLKINERRLTTPLDIYATLEDLLHFSGEGLESEGQGRSISLFRSRVPLNRTCEDVSIQSQWCACVSRRPVPVSDTRVQRSADDIVKKINSLTQIHRNKCAELTLVSIHSASEYDVVLGEDSAHDGFSNFLVTLTVSPSGGIFEGSVWFNGTNIYSVDNSIERVNLYKNQSVCINENALKPYCYCTGGSSSSLPSTLPTNK